MYDISLFSFYFFKRIVKWNHVTFRQGITSRSFFFIDFSYGGLAFSLHILKETTTQHFWGVIRRQHHTCYLLEPW